MQRAALLLIILTVACSGCAPKAVIPAAPAPVVLALTPCPAPTVPALPLLDGESAFDTPANVRVLLDRDSVMRRYIAGLRAALACYAAQTEATHAR